jgi:CRP-like cAMP-binding protein
MRVSYWVGKKTEFQTNNNGKAMNLENLFKDADNIQELQAGSTVFAQGNPGDEMFVVLEGEVEIRMGDEVAETVGTGGIVGELALIDSKARSATVVAKTDCRLAPVNEKRFLFMVQQTPFFALHVMQVLADRLRRMNAKELH